MKRIIAFIISGWIISCSLFPSFPPAIRPTEQTEPIGASATQNAILLSQAPAEMAQDTATSTAARTQEPVRKPTATSTFSATIDPLSFNSISLEQALLDNSDIPFLTADNPYIFQNNPKPAPADSAPLLQGLCGTDCLMRTWKKDQDIFRLSLYRRSSEERAKADLAKLWTEVQQANPRTVLYDSLDPERTAGLLSAILKGQAGWAATASTDANGPNACGTISQFLATSHGPLVIYIKYSREVCLEYLDDGGERVMRFAAWQIEKIDTLLGQ
jgi:hypothetical protein